MNFHIDRYTLEIQANYERGSCIIISFNHFLYIVIFKKYGYNYYATVCFQAHDWSIAVRNCAINSVNNLTLLKCENL